MYMHVCVGVLYCRLNCFHEWMNGIGIVHDYTLKLGSAWESFNCTFSQIALTCTIFTRAHIHGHTHTHNSWNTKICMLREYARTRTHTITHVHTHVNARTCIHTRVCLHVCVCMYVLYVLPKDSLNPAHLPYTLHPTPYTLHPTSYILHPSTLAHLQYQPTSAAIFTRTRIIKFGATPHRNHTKIIPEPKPQY